MLFLCGGGTKKKRARGKCRKRKEKKIKDKTTFCFRHATLNNIKNKIK
jgi:hypothetical protein